MIGREWNATGQLSEHRQTGHTCSSSNRESRQKNAALGTAFQTQCTSDNLDWHFVKRPFTLSTRLFVADTLQASETTKESAISLIKGTKLFHNQPFVDADGSLCSEGLRHVPCVAMLTRDAVSFSTTPGARLTRERVPALPFFPARERHERHPAPGEPRLHQEIRDPLRAKVVGAILQPREHVAPRRRRPRVAAGGTRGIRLRVHDARARRPPPPRRHVGTEDQRGATGGAHRHGRNECAERFVFTPQARICCGKALPCLTGVPRGRNLLRASLELVGVCVCK